MMSQILVVFRQMQPLGVFETLDFNDAHIAIAQYKNNRILVFDRVPIFGEIVRFPAPQGRGAVFFKVDEVQHLPSDLESLPAATPAPHSLIFLRPLIV